MKATFGKSWTKSGKRYRWAYCGKYRQKQRYEKGKWKYFGKVFAVVAGGVWVVTKAVGLWVYFHRISWGHGF